MHARRRTASPNSCQAPGRRAPGHQQRQLPALRAGLAGRPGARRLRHGRARLALAKRLRCCRALRLCPLPRSPQPLARTACRVRMRQPRGGGLRMRAAGSRRGRGLARRHLRDQLRQQLRRRRRRAGAALGHLRNELLQRQGRRRRPCCRAVLGRAPAARRCQASGRGGGREGGLGGRRQRLHAAREHVCDLLQHAQRVQEAQTQPGRGLAAGARLGRAAAPRRLGRLGRGAAVRRGCACRRVRRARAAARRRRVGRAAGGPSGVCRRARRLLPTAALMPGSGAAAGCCAGGAAAGRQINVCRRRVNQGLILDLARSQSERAASSRACAQAPAASSERWTTRARL
jgi:hypothetical protein